MTSMRAIGAAKRVCCLPRQAPPFSSSARAERLLPHSSPPSARDREAHGSSNQALRPDQVPLSRDSLLFAQQPEASSSSSGSHNSDTAEPSKNAASAPTAAPCSASSSSQPDQHPKVETTARSDKPPNPPPLGSTDVVITSSHDEPHARPAFPIPHVPFATQQFLRTLESSGFERRPAEILMDATRAMLLEHERRASAELLGRQDLENEAYLYTAALSELRTESGVKARNDGILLRGMTAALQRETDSVSQRLKEDMQRLQSDIQLEMNTRKEETNQESKAFEIKIMDLNSRFTVIMGDVRTEIESTKWISTRRVMTALVVIVVSILGIFTLAPDKTKKKEEEKAHIPTVEDFGVRPDPNAGEAGGREGWWWSSGPSTVKNAPRVGEEDDT